MLTVLVRPLVPSHQYSPPLTLAAVKTHDLFAVTAPPSGEQPSVWEIVVLFEWLGEKCLSLQPVELGLDTGHCTVKRSLVKICLVLGVTVSEGGVSSRGEGGKRRGEPADRL